jgi:hypothetical protein
MLRWSGERRRLGRVTWKGAWWGSNWCWLKIFWRVFGFFDFELPRFDFQFLSAWDYDLRLICSC